MFASAIEYGGFATYELRESAHLQIKTNQVWLQMHDTVAHFPIQRRRLFDGCCRVRLSWLRRRVLKFSGLGHSFHHGVASNTLSHMFLMDGHVGMSSAALVHTLDACRLE